MIMYDRLWKFKRHSRISDAIDNVLSISNNTIVRVTVHRIALWEITLTPIRVTGKQRSIDFAIHGRGKRIFEGESQQGGRMRDQDLPDPIIREIVGIEMRGRCSGRLQRGGPGIQFPMLLSVTRISCYTKTYKWTDAFQRLYLSGRKSIGIYHEVIERTRMYEIKIAAC